MNKVEKYKSAALITLVPKSKDIKQIEQIIPELDSFVDKKVTTGSIITIKNIDFKVKAIKPKGSVKITPDTEFEILVKSVKSIFETIIAIDTSYSMRNSDYEGSRYSCAMNSAISYISTKTNSDEKICVVTFAHTPNIIYNLDFVKSENVGEISNKLTDVRCAGRTSIGNLIETCQHIFSEYGTSANIQRILMLTDGIDNIGKSVEESTKIAKQNNITIYPVLINKDTSSGALLKQIAEITNGKFYYASNENELKEIMAEFSGEKEFIAQPTYENNTKKSGLIDKIKKKVW